MKLSEIMEMLIEEGAKKPVVSLVGAGGKTTCVLELARSWAKKGYQVLAVTTTHMESPDSLGVKGAVGEPGEVIAEKLKRYGWILAGEPAKEPGKIQSLKERDWAAAKAAADRIVIEADGAKRFPVKVPGRGEPVIRKETTHILVLAGLSGLGKPLREVCHRLEAAAEILKDLEKPQEQPLTASMLGRLLEEGYVKPLKEQGAEKKLAVLLNQAELLGTSEQERDREAKKVLEAVQRQVSVPVFLREQEKEVHFIYLAAGFSSRFGENKLLASVEGKPMYAHLLDRLEAICREGGAASLTVVTQYREIESAVKKQGIPTAWNPDSGRGISSSLKLGLAGAQSQAGRGEEHFYCFFVADQPHLSKKTVERFLQAFLQSGQGIGCVSHGGIPGNPVIFQEKYGGELFALTGDTGGKQVLKRHGEDVFFYEVKEERELRDYDEKKALEGSLFET